jgi:hypothetical protein
MHSHLKNEQKGEGGMANDLVTDSKSKYPNQKGFVQIIVIIIATLIFLRLIGVNIVDILDKPWFIEFAHDVKDMSLKVWADIVAIFSFMRNI